MSNSTTATVETLTAEVRVLMVGSRQVTLSVARQLDEVDAVEIEPFGRIRIGTKKGFAVLDQIDVIGSADGMLVRAETRQERYLCSRNHGPDTRRLLLNGLEVIPASCPGNIEPCAENHLWTGWLDEELVDEWRELPLIVLAGLR